MIAIMIKSTNTLQALHETDGRIGDIISLYSSTGEFIEDCVIFKCSD